MDTKQTLNILDKYFDTFEIFGTASDKDFITLVYLMFIDEYYELKRGISFKDIDNDEIGLTDCLVKKLNSALEYFKSNSSILKGIELDYLPTKIHWIIPDDPYEDEDYIKDNILYTNDVILDTILHSHGTINNKILQL